MIITVFGASGQVGKYVVHQALDKGYFVRAFGRNIEGLIDKELRDKHLLTIKGYIFDEQEVLDAITGADAVISVLGGPVDGSEKTRSIGMKNIITQMEKAGVKRIVALGGMGVLNDNQGHFLIHAPDYPKQFKLVGLEHLQAFQYLQQSSLDWTFVCSPDILNKGITGQYSTNADYLPEPNNGQITAGDLAYFMLQEIAANKYLRRRVGISRL
jgi:putative NADH-flavin reductase